MSGINWFWLFQPRRLRKRSRRRTLTMIKKFLIRGCILIGITTTLFVICYCHYNCYKKNNSYCHYDTTVVGTQQTVAEVHVVVEEFFRRPEQQKHEQQEQPLHSQTTETIVTTNTTVRNDDDHREEHQKRKQQQQQASSPIRQQLRRKYNIRIGWIACRPYYQNNTTTPSTNIITSCNQLMNQSSSTIWNIPSLPTTALLVLVDHQQIEMKKPIQQTLSSTIRSSTNRRRTTTTTTKITKTSTTTYNNNNNNNSHNSKIMITSSNIYYSDYLSYIPDISEVGRDYYTLLYEYDLTQITKTRNSETVSTTTTTPSTTITRRLLHFEGGINYIATAYLDGLPIEPIHGCTRNRNSNHNINNDETQVPIPRSDCYSNSYGPFHRYSYDISHGTKSFSILIEPPLHPGSCHRYKQKHNEKHNYEDDTDNVDTDDNEYGYCQEGQGGDHSLAQDGMVPQYLLGWDWCQSIPDRSTGINGPVSITEYYHDYHYHNHNHNDNNDNNHDHHLYNETLWEYQKQLEQQLQYNMQPPYHGENDDNQQEEKNQYQYQYQHIQPRIIPGYFLIQDPAIQTLSITCHRKNYQYNYHDIHNVPIENSTKNNSNRNSNNSSSSHCSAVTLNILTRIVHVFPTILTVTTRTNTTTFVLRVTADWNETWEIPFTMNYPLQMPHKNRTIDQYHKSTMLYDVQQQIQVTQPEHIHLWWPHNVLRNDEIVYLHHFTFTLLLPSSDHDPDEQINRTERVLYSSEDDGDTKWTTDTYRDLDDGGDHYYYLDEMTIPVGIRTLTTYLDEKTQGQTFVVNGYKLYLVGGNWISTDQIFRYSTTNYHRYYHELLLHRTAGINLLRVWGGGIIESTTFYNVADELGLLILQEFIMTGDNNGRWAGNYSWPLNHETYLTTVQDTILRLRRHPSLLFYCGCNECLAPPSHSSNPPDDIDSGIRNLVHQYDPNRFYIPSSMGGYNFADNFRNPDVWLNRSFSLSYADGPYGLLLPHEFFKRNPGLIFRNDTTTTLRTTTTTEEEYNDPHSTILIGFQPEIGSTNAPTYNGLLRFMTEQDARLGYPRRNSDVVGKIWKFHKYQSWLTKIETVTSSASTTKISPNGSNVTTISTSYYDHVYAYFPEYGYDMNVSEWCSGTQLASYIQNLYLMNGFICHLFEYTTTVIYWKSQSPWPSLRGYYYDWYLESTGAYRGTQAALQNTISTIFDPNDGSIWFVNRQLESFLLSTLPEVGYEMDYTNDDSFGCKTATPYDSSDCPVVVSMLGAEYTFISLTGDVVETGIIYLSPTISTTTTTPPLSRNNNGSIVIPSMSSIRLQERKIITKNINYKNNTATTFKLAPPRIRWPNENNQNINTYQRQQPLQPEQEKDKHFCTDVCFLRLVPIVQRQRSYSNNNNQQQQNYYDSDFTSLPIQSPLKPTWYWLSHPKYGETSNFTELGLLRQRQHTIVELQIINCTMHSNINSNSNIKDHRKNSFNDRHRYRSSKIQKWLSIQIRIQVDPDSPDVFFYPTFTIYPVVDDNNNNNNNNGSSTNTNNQNRKQQEPEQRPLLPLFDDCETDVVFIPGDIQNRTLRVPVTTKTKIQIQLVMSSWNHVPVRQSVVCM